MATATLTARTRTAAGKGAECSITGSAEKLTPWWPGNAKLYTVRAEILSADGKVLDVAEDRVTGIVVEDRKNGGRQTIPVSALFVAIGHTPMSELFTGQVELHPNGYIRTVPDPACRVR